VRQAGRVVLIVASTAHDAASRSRTTAPESDCLDALNRSRAGRERLLFAFAVFYHIGLTLFLASGARSPEDTPSVIVIYIAISAGKLSLSCDSPENVFTALTTFSGLLREKRNFPALLAIYMAITAPTAARWLIARSRELDHC
jgi:hypothetical protein